MQLWIINHNAVPPSLGSQFRHFYFAKYLEKKEINIKILTSSAIHNSDVNMVQNRQKFVEKSYDKVSYIFIKTDNYKGNGIRRIYNLIQFPIKIWPICNYFIKDKPDIIYTSSPNILAAFSALIFAKKHHIKSILEIRDLWPESIIEYLNWSPHNPIIKILYRMEHWMYKTADRLIFTFEGGEQYIRDKGWKDINFNKISHLNNGVDYNEYLYNKENFCLSDADLINPDTFKIIYTGAIRKANNIQQIVDCAKYLLPYKNIKFLIYGSGNELDNLMDYCEKQGITNVSFKGRVDKKYIPFILSKSNLNLINYQQTNMFRYGGSQNKLFDYLASGKPIISNVHQNYCLINRYHCGVSEALTDAISYAEAILSIYNCSEDEYLSMCQNSYQTAMLYDYKKLSEKLFKIINDLNEEI